MAIIEQSWGWEKPPLGAMLNLSHPLANGLVGRWLFNEHSGGTVYDLSGNNYHGTLTGAPTWSAGPTGQVLAFSGTGQYITAPMTFAATGDMSISWRMNPDSTGAGPDYIFSFLAAGSWQTAIWWYPDFNVLRASSNNDATEAEWTLPASVEDSWHHWVLLRNAAGTMTLYIDSAVQTATSSASGTPGTAGVSINIGARDGGGQPFQGKMDDFRVYNRTLTIAELRLLYSQPFADMVPMSMPFGKTPAAAGGGFQAAWAQNSNVVWQPGAGIA